MPISDWHGISDIMNEVVRLAPKSVLDLGAGFGLYGALCRNYLDALHGRCKREQWKTTIRGFEVFPGYKNPTWELYSSMHVELFNQEDLEHQGWDLVLMIDSLEHLTSDAGAKFLDDLVENNRHVIVSVPNGHMEQGAAHGNEYETHRATYFGPELLTRYSNARYLHQGVCIVLSIPGRLK